MRCEKIGRLLALSHEARWTFPSSSDSPILKSQGEGAWVERFIQERESFVKAAHFLMESGDEEAAAEIAANARRV